MGKAVSLIVVGSRVCGHLNDTRYSSDIGSDYRDELETNRLESSLTSHPSRLLQQHYVSTIRTCIPVVCIFPSSRHSYSLVHIT
jgi:hypothetical protein